MPYRGEWVGGLGCEVALSPRSFTPFLIGDWCRIIQYPRALTRRRPALQTLQLYLQGSSQPAATHDVNPTMSSGNLGVEATCVGILRLRYQQRGDAYATPNSGTAR